MYEIDSDGNPVYDMEYDSDGNEKELVVRFREDYLAAVDELASEDQPFTY